jgi:hypothetical protein
MPRPGRVRLSMDLPIHTHKELKRICKIRNMKMTDYIRRLINAQIKEEKNYILIEE